jgi:hypothetical protein
MAYVPSSTDELERKLIENPNDETARESLTAILQSQGKNFEANLRTSTCGQRLLAGRLSAFAAAGAST